MLPRRFRIHGLPMSILRSWDEVRPEKLRDWRDSLAPMFNQSLRERLTVEYWVELIRGRQRELESTTNCDKQADSNSPNPSAREDRH